MTIDQIIENCGGADAIAGEASSRGIKLTKWAVYKWRDIGIPDRHWPLLTALSAQPLEDGDLAAANRKAREAAQAKAEAAQ